MRNIQFRIIADCFLLKGSTKEVPIADPVFKYYEPHEGEINTVRFSPNRQDMFLSTASDAEARIYVIGQVKHN